MIVAIQYAREHDIPFLGICLGMEGANQELNSIRSWCELVDFANNHGGKMWIDED